MELQNTMKVKSLCLIPILAENPFFAKGKKETELITAIALEDGGISVVPDDVKVQYQYERALAYIRELTNHTIQANVNTTTTTAVCCTCISILYTGVVGLNKP